MLMTLNMFWLLCTLRRCQRPILGQRSLAEAALFNNDTRVHVHVHAKLTLYCVDSAHRLLEEPGPDQSRYRVKVSFLSCMILHDDPPTVPGNGIDKGQ